MKDILGNDHGGLYLWDIPDIDLRTKLMDVWYKGARRIPVPSGGMIIFNSKTIHQGYKGGKRLALPVSWENRIYQTAETFERKIRILHQLLPTTHWASQAIVHPMSWQKVLPFKFDGRKFHNNVFPTRSIRCPILINSDGIEVELMRREWVENKETGKKEMIGEPRLTTIRFPFRFSPRGKFDDVPVDLLLENIKGEYRDYL
jgi:hypothetical protein